MLENIVYPPETPDPRSATAIGIGREKRPELHPIPVSRPFQIWVIYIMVL